MGIQLVIRFLYLFKGFLGKKFSVPHLKNFLWSLSEDKGAPLHVDQPIQMKRSEEHTSELQSPC